MEPKFITKEPKFTVSEVFRHSWRSAKSQIWVLAGLVIGYTILSLTLSLFAMPMQSSVAGRILMTVLSLFISILFTLGYTKNLFQTLDDIEPQFSAYGQQSRKTITYLLASLIFLVCVCIGYVFLIIPGFYLGLRLQFYQAFIVEEDAGVLESLRRSWQITEGHVWHLFLLTLAMLGLMFVGMILFIVGIFFIFPVIFMMYCDAFRRLNTPLAIAPES